jgi:hypothetical protein
MIIPGTYRDISPYLEIAADELLYLYHHGCENDPDIGAMLLNFQADHKGMVLARKLANVGSRIGACYKCDIEGLKGPGLHVQRPAVSRARQVAASVLRRAQQRRPAGTQDTVSRKNTIYPNWTSCPVQEPHHATWRHQASQVNLKEAGIVQPNVIQCPLPKSGAWLREQAMKSDKATERGLTVDHPSTVSGVNASYPLQLLPTFDEGTMCHPDPAHCLSNECKAIFRCITASYTPAQMATITSYEATVNKRWSPNAGTDNHPPWHLTKEQIKTGLERGLNLLKTGFVPSLFCSLRIWKVFENPGHLKMSEHILMLGPISKYMLQGLLPTSQQGALFNYLDILGRLWSRKQSICDIDKLISDTAAAQTGMEAHFPGWELNLNRHLIRHIAEASKVSGPVPTFTTFFFERLWGRLGLWLNQHVHPEATMMLQYKNFMALSHWDGVHGRRAEGTAVSTSMNNGVDLDRATDPVVLPAFLQDSADAEVCYFG